MSRQASTRKNIPEEALLEGVPAWMRSSIERFIAQKITGHDVAEVGRSWNAKMHNVDAIERYLQIQLEGSTPTTTYQNVMQYVGQDDERCLDVVEAILATESHVQYSISPLNTILTTSGSKWMAVMQDSGQATLEERVSESAQNAFAIAVKESDFTTQQFLKTAWSDAFGRNPNASSAYSNSIKAIEAASWQAITPNDNKATLGTMLGELRSNIGRWKTSINDKSVDQGITVVKDIMQHIWDGQTDRHGTANTIAPSQEAAEQAILYAVVICNFFNRKLAAKK
jgi:uncharacterized protein YqgV (UPF0045/DUF77 family)